MPSDVKGPSKLELRRQHAMVKQIRTYYRLGQRIDEVLKVDGGTIEAAITKLRWSKSRFTAYKAHEFAQWDEVDVDFITDDQRDGAPLSWSHVVALCAIKKEAERRRWMQKAAKEQWSAARLRSELPRRTLPEDNLRSKSGRKFLRERNPGDMIQALDGYLQRPLRYLQHIRGKPGWKPAEEKRLESLEAAIVALTTLAERRRSAKKSARP
ncbi:MAG TPA: hypothetical protein VM165_05925 [Planctomycetaceae bacterium]|nr:hypothetical protein [Planctomycetaceae bacterium]